MKGVHVDFIIEPSIQFKGETGEQVNRQLYSLMTQKTML